MEDRITPDDDRIDAVAVAWCRIVAPRVRLAVRLHKLRNADTRLRVVPWPHVDRYNAFVNWLVSAPLDDATRMKIVRTPEQIVRKLLAVSRAIPGFALEERRTQAEPSAELQRWAIEFILAHLEVGSHARPTRMLTEPLAVDGLRQWTSIATPQTIDGLY